MEKILVLDFGGQYNQLIARRVRELHVFAEIKAYDRIAPAQILEEGYRGVIFTGGPNSVYDSASPHYDPAVLELGIPILGICYGDQLLAWMSGGEVSPAAQAGEYGKTELTAEEHPLFRGVPRKSVCWMSHRDYISRTPPGFCTLAVTDHCPCAAMGDDRRKLYGVQFHPEVTHTEYGSTILHNFLYDICGCRGDWGMEDYAERAVEGLRERLRDKTVLLALSGGVDSSVAALLLHRAVGERLRCVFVDHGLLRKGEAALVERTFRPLFGEKLICVDARERFLTALAGVTEPERKRKIIGEAFIRVFEAEARKLGHVNALAQGTIYPDVIESGRGDSAVIKSHHNVGGLPAVIDFDELAEPLRELFKDEVRRLGEALGLPRELIWRQPFPGPGLAVRVLGEVTEERLSRLREADAIFREEIAAARPDPMPDQYFAVLTDARSVGVQGDGRSYGDTVALRAVSTDDFMTAAWTRLPYELLERASSRITNEVPGVTRVVYDISSKPPATVEWE
jgi:GMP synthase (glutamine-hydrolyzing), C-terminal domain or B subunit/GMP synthase (glutamine-hydrolyzing), N-terminal domain or A subunit